MEKHEIQALQDDDFIRRLVYYDHENTDLRIHEAYNDSASKISNLPKLEDIPDFTDEFVKICENIIMVAKREGWSE